MAASAPSSPIARPIPAPAAEVSAGGAAANEPHGACADGTPGRPPSNLISRTVTEICTLTAAIHDLREDLRARGVDFHQTNTMVERGLKDPPEDHGDLVSDAVERARQALGPDAITREALEEMLERLVALEKDNRHVRLLAREQGVHMQALNFLTQLIGLNPGDGGVQSVNMLIAYADAAGVPFDRVGALRSQFEDEPASVLPDIPRDPRPTRAESLRELGVNVVVGLMLTVIVMGLTL